MNKNNIDKAKKIFFNYSGSHFQMARENEYDIYKKYNISREQELIWIKEMLNNILQKIKMGDEITNLYSKYSQVTSLYNDLEGLKMMIEIAKDKKDISDSFIKLR